MIHKKDWVTENPAMVGKDSRLKFLENMQKEFDEAQEVIKNEISKEKENEKKFDEDVDIAV